MRKKALELKMFNCNNIPLKMLLSELFDFAFSDHSADKAML